MLHRYVSFDGINVALQQDFTYANPTWSGLTTWSQRQTTVKTTDELRGSVSSIVVYTYAALWAGGQPDDQATYAAQLPVEQQVVDENGGSNPVETFTKAWYNSYEMACQLDTHDSSALRGVYYLYGGGSQVTDKKEFDYGQIGSTSACSQSQLTAPGGLTARRETQTAYNLSLVNYFGFHILDRPASVIVVNFDGAGDNAETDYLYDKNSLGPTSFDNHDYKNYSSTSSVPRGNATTKSVTCAPGCGTMPWTYNYDDTGQQLKMTNPRTNFTTYSYSAAYQGAYLTQITYPQTGTVAHIVSFTYDFAGGQLATFKDQNGQTTGKITSYAYSDPLGRLTSITYPDLGQTGYSYGSTECGKPTGTSILLQGSTYYTETATLDGLCHVTDRAITSDPQGTDYTDTTYDGMGRVWKLSNPYRSGDSTAGDTTYVYDALGRTTSATYPDGSATTTSYSSNTSTVTDPSGAYRTFTYDGLERLSAVNEAGTYNTSYGHNALDDLVKVSQGAQTRTFVYDSMSRMTSATNPESGTTSYTYDADGDVLTKTDARNITTTYAYDALDRLTSKTYSDGTAPAAFGYDETSATLGSWTSPGLQNPIGRLTHTATTSGSTVLSGTIQDYDPMGRTQHYWDCTPAWACGDLEAVYYYDKAGDVQTWVHPAFGITFTNTIGGARRVTAVSATSNGLSIPTSLAPAVTYTAWGAIKTLQEGCLNSGCTTVQETYDYNNRMQPVRIQLGTSSNNYADYCLVYNYYLPPVGNPSSCTATPTQSATDNGNVQGFWYEDNVNTGFSRTEAFSYDSREPAARGTSDRQQHLQPEFQQLRPVWQHDLRPERQHARALCRV